MMSGTKIGILLDTRGPVIRAYESGNHVDPVDIIKFAKDVETAEFDSIWVGDSLVSKPRLDPIALLSSLAQVTSRVTLGTAVLLPALRQPVLLAHSLASLDVLSGGRLVTGVGVGGTFTPEQKNDWVSAGVVPGQRAGRLSETSDIMRKLWTADKVDFNGRYFQIHSVSLYPKPVQAGGIPIFFATHYRTGSEAQYLRAATYGDGLIGITDSPEQYAEVVRRTLGFVSDLGKSRSQFERVFYLTVNVGSPTQASAEADDFLMAYYGVRHWGDRWGPWGKAEDIANTLGKYAAAGATHLVVRFASWNQREQLDRFVNQVLPIVHRSGVL